MSNEHDWLSKCVKEIDVTDVGEKRVWKTKIQIIQI